LGREIRFRTKEEAGNGSGNGARDAAGRVWDLSGDPRTLDMEIVEGGIRYGEYPDALERLWGCLLAPRCGDVVLSATPGHTFGEISGTFHAGSDHGSLHASDSNVFVLAAGFPGSADGFAAPRRITEITPTLLAHFGAGAATAMVDAGT
jgi:hypothetical protein